MKRVASVLIASVAAVVALHAQETIDRAMVAKIRAEATDGRRCPNVRYITDVTGARLTEAVRTSRLPITCGEACRVGAHESASEVRSFGRGRAGEVHARTDRAALLPDGRLPAGVDAVARVLTGTPVGDRPPRRSGDGGQDQGAIVLAAPVQTVFAKDDRKQPADTDQLVRIGGPEPSPVRQAASVVRRTI